MSGESPVVELYNSDGYQLAVNNGVAIPANTPALLLAGSDGTNSRYILVDGSSRQVVAGAGTAGTPAGGVITIQGDPSGTPIPISGNITASNASVGTNDAAIPGFSTLIAGSDGTNLRSLRVFDLDSGGGTQWILGVGLRKSAGGGSVEFGTASDPIRTDPTGTTTQPVSGTVTANQGGSWTVAGTGNFTVVQSTASNLRAQLASESTTGTAIPSTAVLMGGSDGSNLRPIFLDASGRQIVIGAAANGAAVTGNPVLVAGSDGTNARSIRTATDGTVRVDPTGTTTQPVSGTVTANQGTAASLSSKWPVQVTDGTNTMPTGDAVGRAIFEKITDGTNTATVKAASTAPAATDPALVVALSPNTDLFAFGGDQRLRIGQETLLFFDNVDGTTVDTNKWTQSQSGMTQTQTGGNLTLNAGSSLTSGNYSILTSNKQMLILDEFPLYVQFRAKLVPQTNAVLELGFGNAATTATPTDGVFFRVDTAGNVKGVINFNGTETTTANLTSLTSTTFYNFEIAIFEDHATFEIQSSDNTTNIDIDLAIPLTSGSPVSVGHLPVYARVYNSSTTSSAAQIILASVNVQQMDLNMNKPWAEQVAGAGRASLIDPSTLAQSANYTNNTAPVSATLSNTAAGYTTLGGLFQFAAVAGSETDYALFAYQVPTGFQLYVWSITITAFVTGAQSTTNPTLLQWAVGANSSAVSLATGAPNPPIRTPIGMQQANKTANIGDPFNPGTITYAPKTPIIINSGKYLHIILRIPIANATTNQIIRGSCTVEGYFE